MRGSSVLMSRDVVMFSRSSGRSQARRRGGCRRFHPRLHGSDGDQGAERAEDLHRRPLQARAGALRSLPARGDNPQPPDVTTDTTGWKLRELGQHSAPSGSEDRGRISVQERSSGLQETLSRKPSVIPLSEEESSVSDSASQAAEEESDPEASLQEAG